MAAKIIKSPDSFFILITPPNKLVFFYLILYLLILDVSLYRRKKYADI